MPLSNDVFGPLLLRAFAYAAKVLLGIYYEAFSASEGFLKERITGCEWHAVIAAFDDEIGRGKEGFHLLESGSMMSEEVGSREGVKSWEGRAGDEGRDRHCTG